MGAPPPSDTEETTSQTSGKTSHKEAVDLGLGELLIFSRKTEEEREAGQRTAYTQVRGHRTVASWAWPELQRKGGEEQGPELHL